MSMKQQPSCKDMPVSGLYQYASANKDTILRAELLRIAMRGARNNAMRNYITMQVMKNDAEVMSYMAKDFSELEHDVMVSLCTPDA